MLSYERFRPPQVLFGIEVARSPNGIFLCQRKYALDIITEVGLLGAKPATTPCEKNHKLGSAIGSFLSDPATYCRLVGRLIYMCFTRPYLTYCVQVYLNLCKIHAPSIDKLFFVLFDI